jgi:ferredoxin-NADP reductase
MGDFVLPKDTAIPLVFVAGGIGITPFHAMLEWMASQSDHRNLKFIYSVRNENEIIFQDTFERAGIHATIVVGEPSDAWGGERGRLSAEMILGLTHPTPETLIYMSGPEPLVEALEKDMHAQGIAKQQLVSDFFPGYLGV